MAATAVKERPVLFSGEMVRAILAGRKTMTRRIVKPQPIQVDGELRFKWATFFDNGHVHTWDREGTGGQNWQADEYPNENKFRAALRRTPYEKPCPYGSRGDRLWVRETWTSAVSAGMAQIAYAADGRWGSMSADFKPVFHGWTLGVTDKVMEDWQELNGNWVGRSYFEKKWRPSIHMPRSVARIILDITDVRVERLQDITEEDAVREGVTPGDGSPVNGFQTESPYSATAAFAGLWESINGPGSWDANPWVWAIAFRLTPAT